MSVLRVLLDLIDKAEELISISFVLGSRMVVVIVKVIWLWVSE